MSREIQEFGLLTAALAVCLLVGLVLEGRFVAAQENLTVAEAADTLSTLSIKCLTFCWICGLQTGALWLILGRLRGERQRREQRSEEASLLNAQELVRTRDAVILGLAKLAESRDPETGHHLERIARYGMTLAMALRRLPKFRAQISPQFIRTLGISSALHDIGKVGIEDSILLKRGPLTNEQRRQMEQHTLIGAECIRQIQRRIGSSSFLDMAYEITLYHHERWDGSGYPHGLRGEAIPLAARILAIADVYDALSVARVYKPALPHSQCLELIREGAGGQFDPELVETFLSVERQFQEIAQRYAGEPSGLARQCSPLVAPAAGEGRVALLEDDLPLDSADESLLLRQTA